MIVAVFLLLALYQLKHVLADYFLQNSYMMGKFKAKGWALPLAHHCLVHALFTDVIAGTALILLYPGRPMIWALGTGCALGSFDFLIHFAMDRIKTSPSLLGRYKALSGKEYVADAALARPMTPGAEDRLSTFDYWDRIEAKQRLYSNVRFWWALGFDQMVHHLTHYAIIAFLVTR